MGLGAIRDFFYGGVELVDEKPRKNEPEQKTEERRKEVRYDSNRFGEGEYRNDEYEQRREYREDGYEVQNQRPRIIPSREVKQPMPLGGLIVFHARGIDDVQKIIDYLNAGNALVVDFSEVKDSKNNVAQRILDFLSGAIYAIDGTIGELSPYVYTLSPNGVAIVSDR